MAAGAVSRLWDIGDILNVFEAARPGTTERLEQAGVVRLAIGTAHIFDCDHLFHDRLARL